MGSTEIVVICKWRQPRPLILVDFALYTSHLFAAMADVLPSEAAIALKAVIS